MKTFINLFITLFCSLSVFASSGKVKIKGIVKNASLTTVTILHLNNQSLVSAELDTQGNFEMTTKLEDGYYLLQYGRNMMHIYLYPKDELTITFDANDFDGSLKYVGQGAERNNYLVKKAVIDANLTKDLVAFYKVNEATYLNNLEHVKATHLSSLSSYTVEDYFKMAEKKSLEYDRLLSIQNYKTSYKFYLGEEANPSEDFYKPIKKIKLDNDEEYQKQPYYRYLVNSIWNERIEAESTVDGMLKVFREVSSQPMAISLVNGFYSKISSRKERAKDYLDLIKRITNYKPFIEAAEKQYEEVMNPKALVKGDISPSFSYESIDGSTVSLTDFKGKYVYIDVWATWCAPCLSQVPYLKALEEQFHDKNIVFVSISVDKGEVKNKWRKMIAEKKMGGVQLFADKSFDSDFMNAYAINSIPRFILIDPEGTILDPEAPRPSFDKTKKLLDSLLD